MTVNIIVNDKQVDTFDVVKDQDDNLVRVEPADRVQYWDEKASNRDMYDKCLQWFGIELSGIATIDVRKMLKDYPGRTMDEAIETVLTIYISNKNLKPKV